MRPGWVRKAAQEMIDKLFGLAEEGGPKSKRYVELAKKRSKKYKARLAVMPPGFFVSLRGSRKCSHSVAKEVGSVYMDRCLPR